LFNYFLNLLYDTPEDSRTNTKGEFKDMLTVIFPVLNQIEMTDIFLKHISDNVVLPERIIMIDNDSTENVHSLIDKYSNLPIEYILRKKRATVNNAWNIGLKLCKTPLLSILNNDIIFSKYFFKKIIEASEKYKEYGIFCGNTIKNKKLKNDIYKTNDDSPIVKTMGKREGWAFTIRKEIIDKINLIPPELKTYCGDDYLYFMTREVLKYKAGKIMNNSLYHFGGMTVGTGFRQEKNRRKKEKVIWENLKRGLL